MFIFRSKTANDMRISDWSSDVCSSDLLVLTGLAAQQRGTSTTASANVHPTALLGATLPAETRDYIATANSEPALTTDSRAAYAILNWNHPGIDTKLLGSYYSVRAHDYVYRSEEHTSELQSLMRISYAVFCLKKKKQR